MSDGVPRFSWRSALLLVAASPLSCNFLLDFDAYRTGAGGAGGEDRPDTTTGTQGGGNPGAWWDPAFTRRALLSLSEVPEEPLSDFPLLVRLDPARFAYEGARPDGEDLRFVAADGQTSLPYEIERWSPNGESFVWVRLPLVGTNGGHDHLWLYYGNPAATSAASGVDTWAPEHLGVYHLGSAGAQEMDSSAGQHEGVWTDGDGAATPGVIADASTFDLTRFLNFGGVPDFEVDPGDARTIEAWIVANDTGADVRYVLYNEGGCLGWSVGLKPDGTIEGRLLTGIDCMAGYQAHLLSSPTGIADGQWHHVALVVDRPAERIALYLDGVSVASTMTQGDPGASAAGGYARVGTDWNDTHPFRGAVDEFRISSVTRSPIWMALQVASMQDKLVTFGPTEQQ